MIETAIWKDVTGKPGLVRRVKGRPLGEIYKELLGKLSGYDLSDLDYFRLYGDKKQECPDFRNVRASAAYGTNEGIVLLVTLECLDRGKYCEVPFIIGKTLDTSDEALKKMFDLSYACYKAIMER